MCGKDVPSGYGFTAEAMASDETGARILLHLQFSAVPEPEGAEDPRRVGDAFLHGKPHDFVLASFKIMADVLAAGGLEEM